MRFVTDFLWRSPLGLRINAQDTAGHDTDRRPGQDPRRPARARRGVRRADHRGTLGDALFRSVSLLAVDHRRTWRCSSTSGSRASRRPSTSTRCGSHGRWRRRGQAGRDVTELVAPRGRAILDTFARGSIRVSRRSTSSRSTSDSDAASGALARRAGLDISDRQQHQRCDRPGAGRASLAGSRWRRRTPGGHGRSSGRPRIPGRQEQDDADRSGEGGRGEPAATADEPGDVLGRAAQSGIGRCPAGVRPSVLPRLARILRYRGFSDPSTRGTSPETPSYGRIADTVPRWRDLGAITRDSVTCGNCWVAVDDRYVIMNAVTSCGCGLPFRRCQHLAGSATLTSTVRWRPDGTIGAVAGFREQAEYRKHTVGTNVHMPIGHSWYGEFYTSSRRSTLLYSVVIDSNWHRVVSRTAFVVLYCVSQTMPLAELPYDDTAGIRPGKGVACTHSRHDCASYTFGDLIRLQHIAEGVVVDIAVEVRACSWREPSRLCLRFGYCRLHVSRRNCRDRANRSRHPCQHRPTQCGCAPGLVRQQHRAARTDRYHSRKGFAR